MNTEILRIAEALKDTFEGDPWFGRPAIELLNEVPEEDAGRKPEGGHSLLELLWHMITWREFTLDRLSDHPDPDTAKWEALDWRPLDTADPTLWRRGLDRLLETQNTLIALLQRQTDDRLTEVVPGRKYTFSKLLHGIYQHDIYHLGQIAYAKKLLAAGPSGI